MSVGGHVSSIHFYFIIRKHIPSGVFLFVCVLDCVLACTFDWFVAVPFVVVFSVHHRCSYRYDRDRGTRGGEPGIYVGELQGRKMVYQVQIV